MSDDPRRLFNAAGYGKTAQAFKAELARATDAQLKYRDRDGDTVLNWMAVNHDWPELAAALIKRGCDDSVAMIKAAAMGTAFVEALGDLKAEQKALILKELGLAVA